MKKQHVQSGGRFEHHSHGLLRAHKALLKMDPGDAAGCEQAANALRDHMQSSRYKMRAGPATERSFTDDLESMLHATMEEHCWGAIAGVANELQEWSTQLQEASSAEVSAQLHALKLRYTPPWR